ncbi:28S ribosomal protein S36, mitochondrial isoform X5 [Dermochelys coriacea]|uniref:28S ribosomal protein S36, mitochondrial isoform X5 n=1 Tax=Dermochelys coriacea TaxID=27794 RepID=UPI001CA9F02D|nr:28S ribosomal protein S36, mitochondrial isoform X5 [Dermochelys coriacea]
MPSAAAGHYGQQDGGRQQGRSVQESLQARVPPFHASAAHMSVGDRPPALQNISSINRVQGTPDTTELVKTLPQKYRRKLMSDEEMEYIQRGGPE